MRKRHLGAVALAAVALVATACGGGGKTNASTSNSNSGSSGTSGSKGAIALVPGDSTDPFYLSMKAAATQEAAKFGYSLIWEGASDFSPEAQAPVLSALLARHPKALLVAPTDPTAVTNILDRYHAAGIPIITVDTTINDTSILTSRITSDNKQGGAAAADACGTRMKGAGTAAVIYTTPGTTTTNLRGQGFIAEMKSKYPNIKVVSEYDNNQESTATSQTSALLLGHPNLKCIFGTNDYAAEGAATAVDSSHDQGKVSIAGYDAEPAMVNLLKNNTIQIVIAQKPAQEATMAVDFAHDYLTGNKGAIQASVQLPNVTMTPGNINSPSVSKWIYKS
jgi:ribose transport system substrate-binding protein